MAATVEFFRKNAEEIERLCDCRVGLEAMASGDCSPLPYQTKN